MKKSSQQFRQSISKYLEQDPDMSGSLLRLAFHDATTREDLTDEDDSSFTGGPNASIRYEIEWNENRGISKPLQVVTDVYEDLQLQPLLSLADCIALAGAEAVEFAGGPSIQIQLGRVDVDKADPKYRRNILEGLTARSKVDTTLPSAALDSDGLRLYFGALDFSEAELVALSGAHDLGRHVTLLDMPKSCLKNLTRQCLEDAPVLMPFVSKEQPIQFSNTYYKKLLKWYDRKLTLGEVAFIPTDVDLVVDDELRKYVQKFAKDQKSFFKTFLAAYQKLVDIGTTTTTQRF